MSGLTYPFYERPTSPASGPQTPGGTAVVYLLGCDAHAGNLILASTRSGALTQHTTQPDFWTSARTQTRVDTIVGLTTLPMFPMRSSRPQPLTQRHEMIYIASHVVGGCLSRTRLCNLYTQV